MENCLSLEGTVLSKRELRYTPAGIPIVECVLHHVSMQKDGTRPRMVDTKIEAQCTADRAIQMAGIGEGSAVRVQGFLTQRSLKSTRLILQIQHIASIDNPVKPDS